MGFACFGFSIAFMKQANFGLGPWDVLSDGLAGLTGMQFGTVSIIIGILLLLLWIPIREKPGLATVLNVLLVGAFANVTLAIVQSPGSAFLRSLWFVTGLILAGLGTVLYLGSQLGAGPRDGLMLGLSRRKRLECFSDSHRFRSACAYPWLGTRWRRGNWNGHLCADNWANYSIHCEQGWPGLGKADGSVMI